MPAELFRLHQTQKIDDSQLSALCFLLMGYENKGASFIGNPRLRQPLDMFLSLSKCELARTFEKAKFKQVKGKAVSALVHWLREEWPLQLFFDIPSVTEVLELQASGSRPVTLFPEADSWSLPKADKANAFEFLVHDLEHAFQYFSYFHQEQLALNKKFLSLQQLGYFEPLKDSELENRLNYLLSDMNTHSAHALSYLKSIWVDYSKLKGFDDIEAFLESKMLPFTEPQADEAIS